MLKLSKRLLTALCALCMSATCMPSVSASGDSDQDSGAVTETISWAYSDGVLTVSGTGAMPEYDNNAVTPWESYKNQITQAVIGDGITRIGVRTFQQYTALTTVTMADTVTNIGSYAFNGCTSLSSVTLSENLASIPPGMFNNTGALKSITVPYITTVDANSFSKTASDVVIKVYPDSAAYTWAASSGIDGETPAVTNIGTSVTTASRAYEVLPLGGDVTDTITWSLTGGTLTISGTGAMPEYDNNAVTPWESYKNQITQVVIGDGITRIGVRTFQQYTALTTVTMADTVTSVGSYLFNGCTSLSSVTLSENLASIPPGMFNNTGALKSITVPYITTVDANSFSKTASDVVITVQPGSAAYTWAASSGVSGRTPAVTDIGTSGTSSGRAYELFALGGDVTETIKWSLNDGTLTISGIGAMPNYVNTSVPWAEYIGSITAAVIDNGITYIGERTFQLHTALKTVTMADTVTSTGMYLFNGCSALTDVKLSHSLTEIAYGTFNRTTALTKLVVPYKASVTANSFVRTSPNLKLTVYKNSPAHIWAASTDNSVLNLSEASAPVAFEVVMPSGKATDTVSWAYDTDTKVLTFSGTGAMPGWTTIDRDGDGSPTDEPTWYELRPWQPYVSDALKIVIGQGITVVGADSFRGSTNLNELILAPSVKELGNYAFANSGIREVILNNGLEKINAGVFQQSTASDALKKIVIPRSVNSINSAAFRNQTAVSIYCYDNSYAKTYAAGNSFDYVLLKSDFYMEYSPVTSRAVIMNYSDSDKNSSVIFANYTDGALTDLYVKNVTLAPGRTEVTATDFSQENGSSTKVMLFDSLSSLTPLCEALSVDIKPSIHIAGDSISAMWPPERYGQQGWGEPFKTYWTDDIKVVNDAVSGWTAEDFYTRKWSFVKSELKEGDYLIVSYLHNDYYKSVGAQGNAGYIDVYRGYIQKLIDETEAMGVNVVLVVPPNRGVANNFHGDFSYVIPQLAAANNVPYIDLHTKTMEMLNADLEGTKKLLYMYKLVEQNIITQEQLNNHSNATLRTTGEDLTHLSTKGAAWIANYVAENIVQVVPELAAYAK